MTLAITLLAACVCTAIWYNKDTDGKFCLSTPCWLFWGASIMWAVDAVFEYIELGAEYFTPAFEDVFNDTLLGISVVALGLVIWIAVLLIKDPKNVLRKRLANK